jgi:hypothetical protein
MSRRSPFLVDLRVQDRHERGRASCRAEGAWGEMSVDLYRGTAPPSNCGCRSRLDDLGGQGSQPNRGSHAVIMGLCARTL